MIEFINNFHFIRPLWLIASIVPVLFYFIYFKGDKNKSSWENVVDKNLLNFLIKKGSAKNRKKIGYFALTGFLATIIAIAGPTWNKKEIPNIQPENPLIIALDLSSDMYNSDISPNRLSRAKYKISDILKELKSVQVGLVVYSDDAFLITPITDDKNIVENLLPNIDIDIMPVNGNRLDKAISIAVESLENAGYKKGNIIILTPNVSQRFDLALDKAKKANNKGFNISILNISAQDDEKLELLSNSCNGKYVRITANDEDIKSISSKINHEFEIELSKSNILGKNNRLIWAEYGYYLVILIMVTTLTFFRKGVMIVLLLLAFSNSAHAGFFINDDQEALKYFHKEDYGMSASKFKNPQWKGSGLYRLGDFENAYEEFSKGNDITSIYNQGNALAKSGKIEEAIKKYEEVLEKEPNHEDAKFNLEYLKKQQEQQNQDNSSNNKNEDNQENNKQNNKEDKEQEEENKDKEEQENKNNSSDDNNKKNEENQSDNKEDEKSNDEKDASKNQENIEQDKENENSKKDEVSQPILKEEKEKEEGNDKAPAVSAQKSEEEKWDEEMQVIEQQYREIPENPGGLLKQLLDREHRKRQYLENER